MKKSIIQNLRDRVVKSNLIDNELYIKYDVKRGLRNISGKGVLAGLTNVAEVIGTEMKNGKVCPVEGKLIYRGIDINEIIEGYISEDRFGFEETSCLLLFGNLPNKEQLNLYKNIIGKYRNLPTGFVRDIIMKCPSRDVMNTMARSVLTLYSFDENPDDISLENILEQSLKLISNFSLLAIYSYAAISHYFKDKSLIIHKPIKELSTAENILHILRPDNNYTKLEARLLDLVLILHADHGGGNNSTFTNHVISSSGTDTYSAIAASLGSLKGPKHGGANIKVTQMMENIKENVKDWEDEEELANYLNKILEKQAFDKLGLIYGMGHAVYSLSDPRAVILKKYAEKLAEEKGMENEFDLYARIERIAPEVIGEHRKIYKGVSANVDFYSGLVYSMLEIPPELFTPLFAVARIVGWSSHRMEEIANNAKIIRPAYKSVAVEQKYVSLDKRGD